MWSGALRFFYCQSGPNGDPLLFVGSVLDDEALRRIEDQVSADYYTRGEIFNESGELVFRVNSDLVHSLQRDLESVFSRKVSALKHARVVSQ